MNHPVNVLSNHLIPLVHPCITKYPTFKISGLVRDDFCIIQNGKGFNVAIESRPNVWFHLGDQVNHIRAINVPRSFWNTVPCTKETLTLEQWIDSLIPYLTTYQNG